MSLGWYFRKPDENFFFPIIQYVSKKTTKRSSFEFSNTQGSFIDIYTSYIQQTGCYPTRPGKSNRKLKSKLWHRYNQKERSTYLHRKTKKCGRRDHSVGISKWISHGLDNGETAIRFLEGINLSLLRSVRIDDGAYSMGTGSAAPG
jgi:hypothetical protein